MRFLVLATVLLAAPLAASAPGVADALDCARATDALAGTVHTLPPDFPALAVLALVSGSADA